MSVCTELNTALRNFVKNYGVPLSKLSIKLGIGPEECLRWWADEKKMLPRKKILQLTRILGVSEDDFILDRLHSSMVDVGILGFKDKINPKYAENPLSYVRSSKHIIEYITLRYGTLVAKSILFRLGVHPAYFDDTKNRINIRFYEDLLKEYLALGNTGEDLRNLSKCMFLTVEDDPQSGRMFPRCRTFANAFHAVKESMTIFEKNFDYEFQIWPERVRVIAKPSGELAESMKNSRYGSRELYQYRSRLVGNMVVLCGLPAVQMQVKKCISQGDNVSIYEAEYPSCPVLSGPFS